VCLRGILSLVLLNETLFKQIHEFKSVDEMVTHFPTLVK